MINARESATEEGLLSQQSVTVWKNEKFHLNSKIFREIRLQLKGSVCGDDVNSCNFLK